eukprot:3365401-Rhodomonas_salina.1
MERVRLCGGPSLDSHALPRPRQRGAPGAESCLHQHIAVTDHNHAASSSHNHHAHAQAIRISITPLSPSSSCDR